MTRRWRNASVNHKKRENTAKSSTSRTHTHTQFDGPTIIIISTLSIDRRHRHATSAQSESSYFSCPPPSKWGYYDELVSYKLCVMTVSTRVAKHFWRGASLKWANIWQYCCCENENAIRVFFEAPNIDIIFSRLDIWLNFGFGWNFSIRIELYWPYVVRERLKCCEIVLTLWSPRHRPLSPILSLSLVDVLIERFMFNKLMCWVV